MNILDMAKQAFGYLIINNSLPLSDIAAAVMLAHPGSNSDELAAAVDLAISCIRAGIVL